MRGDFIPPSGRYELLKAGEIESFGRENGKFSALPMAIGEYVRASLSLPTPLLKFFGFIFVAGSAWMAEIPALSWMDDFPRR